MTLLRWFAAGLAWLGAQGTRALAAMVFIGIALPPLGALLKPFVTESVFLLLLLAFLRVEPVALRRHVKQPLKLAAIAAWTMIAVPGLLGSFYLLIGLDRISPGLYLGLILQAIAAPLMSSPAFAALLGLDAALVLAGMVICTALIPLTAPVFARLFAADTLTLSPLLLGLKLLAMLGGALLLASLIRRLAGTERVRSYDPQIDGVNVVILFVFVAALMGDIGARMMSEPLLVIGLIALSFALTFILLGATALVFARAGRREAFARGLMASQRNMGLMLAATGGVVPDLTWLYFALAQFPTYLLPQMIKPLAERINRPR
ncbi:MAG: Na+-dependent transporter [Pseudorhodoplanes sp.]|nr:Na+-dependent transporter [Pseudorhodoplanes sp.]